MKRYKNNQKIRIANGKITGEPDRPFKDKFKFVYIDGNPLFVFDEESE